ncbi:heterokaryon incompatibility protein-domain-containing protein [Paraphoma chrysanthemicola]|nr:heterokaryon incompatibility protein-domain-containing protein [Paraphoma chrysanthemicola]
MSVIREDSDADAEWQGLDSESGDDDSGVNNVDTDIATSSMSTRDADVQHTYQSISDGCIRLLYLHPGKDDEIVRTNLAVVGLDSRPSYEAISYAWGSSFKLAPMVLNEIHCLRSFTLVECLTNLRSEHDIRILWVDALCINQADVKERNSQVALMGQIYLSASKTIIWLGEDKCMQHEVMMNSNQFSTEAPVHRSSAFNLLKQLAINDHIRFDKQTAVHAIVLARVCELGWWSRAWVVQETLLSKSAHLMLGSATLPWEVVSRAASNYVTHVTACCRPNSTRTAQRDFSDILMTTHGLNTLVSNKITAQMADAVEVILSFQRVPTGTRNELLANLWMYRDRLAKVPHDKIYATLGLLRSNNITIEPDYGMSFADLCRQVVLEDIRASGNLQALKGIRRRIDSKRMKDFPHEVSWCTNWESLDYWAEDRYRVLTELNKHVYAASGLHVARVRAVDDPLGKRHFLHTHGRIFDRITHTSDLLPFERDSIGTKWPRQFANLLRTLRRAKPKDMDRSTYVAGGSLFSAFWRTLVADCIIPAQESQDPFHNFGGNHDDTYEPLIRRAKPSDFMAFLLWWLTGDEYYLLKSVRFGHKRPWQLSKKAPNPAKSQKIPAVHDIHVSVARATSGRRMFTTRKGYIGLGPELTKQGDEVAILLGGSTPFVLEKSGIKVLHEDVYYLLGDCYVHGCMDGKLVENEDTETWPFLILG